MHAILNHRSCALGIAIVVFPLVVFACVARADILQWEYINPADPSRGKRQSTTLAPDGAGVDAVPGADLTGRNLTMAYLIGADLTNADFPGAILWDADFAGAKIQNARFNRVSSYFYIPYCRWGGSCPLVGGITLSQLYSTASYQAKDLSGVGFGSNNLSDGNFAGQNLMNASFEGATLTGADFTGAEVRGANLGATGFSHTQLYSTASYQAHDLSGIGLSYSDLTGGNFAGQHLTNASFSYATLTNADFTGAEVRGANLEYAQITLVQLYSTASYQAGDLSGIDLAYNNLAGGNFAGQKLTNAALSPHLTGADFTAADARGAYISDAPTAITTNLIRRDGHIGGLGLAGGGLLVLRDYDGDTFRWWRGSIWQIPITVDQHLSMGSGGTLRMVFEADAWDSTISFAPGIPVTLGGTLELTFTDDVNLASQVGRTLDLFDWTGVNPTGAIAISSPYVWNLSNLYTTGEVMLISVPEPNCLILIGFTIVSPFALRRFNHRLQISTAMCCLVALVSSAQADIFQWEYINPDDASQGKRQSTTLAPDGAGVDAVPGANLSGRNLTMAYLIGADLMNASFSYATLTNADFTGAEVQGANFEDACCGIGTGITLAQLYSTASYQAHNLSGISLRRLDLIGANFAGQNLTNANLSANLTGANFSGADVRGANVNRDFFLMGSGITLGQLYSTSSYQAHDLSGISLWGNTLSGGNFAGQNLTNAYFAGTKLSDADFTGAKVQKASFSAEPCPFTNCDLNGTGITVAQLYSTASYQAHDLNGIDFRNNNLAGGNFAGQILTDASFYEATLTGADFRDADLTNVNFYSANLTDGNFSGQNLTNMTFTDATLTGADFTAANLTNAYFNGTRLIGANLREGNLTNADFTAATLTDANFSDAELSGASFAAFYCPTCIKSGTGLTPAQLYSTASYQAGRLIDINLSGNKLAGVNFADQNLTDANFDDATLTGADFREANLSNTKFGRAALTDANLAGQDLSNADFAGAILTGTDFTGAEVRGANFATIYCSNCPTSGTGLATAQLYSTASYQARDLTGIRLGGNDLIGANFAGQDLSNADFGGATLTDADITGAWVRGANFGKATDISPVFLVGTGITSAQLYSTASYQARDLTGIGFGDGDLSEWIFVGQNLTNSNFARTVFLRTFSGPPRIVVSYATLTGADLTGADTRGARSLRLSGATTTNLILPDGHIDGLNLDDGGLLVVRDYDGAQIDPALPVSIIVDRHLEMGPGGTLRMVFEADEWDSTISFAPGIPVTLGGTLELTFADDVKLASQVGRTFDLFDWTGVNPTGTFAISSPCAWDLSKLYATGEVTLIVVPEPASVALMWVGIVSLLRHRRRLH